MSIRAPSEVLRSHGRPPRRPDFESPGRFHASRLRHLQQYRARFPAHRFQATRRRVLAAATTASRRRQDFRSLIRPVYGRPTGLPGLLRQCSFRLIDIPNRPTARSAVIPIAGIVKTNAAPQHRVDVAACDISRISMTVMSRPPGKVRRDIAVHAGSHRREMIVCGKGGGIDEHRPRLPGLGR